MNCLYFYQYNLKAMRSMTLRAKNADNVDLKDGLLNNRVCTVKFPAIESCFSSNTRHTEVPSTRMNLEVTHLVLSLIYLRGRSVARHLATEACSVSRTTASQGAQLSAARPPIGQSSQSVILLVSQSDRNSSQPPSSRRFIWAEVAVAGSG